MILKVVYKSGLERGRCFLRSGVCYSFREGFVQFRRVAPMVERRIPNPFVVGSSPSSPAIFLREFRVLYLGDICKKMMRHGYEQLFQYGPV